MSTKTKSDYIVGSYLSPQKSVYTDVSYVSPLNQQVFA